MEIGHRWKPRQMAICKVCGMEAIIPAVIRGMVARGVYPCALLGYNVIDLDSGCFASSMDMASTVVLVAPRDW
jgi:hypothetical protein